jgi:hypothetical protein
MCDKCGGLDTRDGETEKSGVGGNPHRDSQIIENEWGQWSAAFIMEGRVASGGLE